MKIKYIHKNDLIHKDSHKARYKDNINTAFAKEGSLELGISDTRIAAQVRRLYESSVIRIMEWIKRYDIAAITVYRNTLRDIVPEHESLTYMKVRNKNGDKEQIGVDYIFKTEEKHRRNLMLSHILLQKGYGVTAMQGNWIEGENPVETVDESFFVVNLNNDPDFFHNLFRLSEWFNQDSFLYKSKEKSDAYQIGTNNAAYPGYGQRNISGGLTALPSKFMSRIRNAAIVFVNKDRWKIHDKIHDLTAKNITDTFPPISYQNAHLKKATESLLEDWHKLVADKGVYLDEKPHGLARQAFGRAYWEIVGDDEPEGF